MTNAAIGVGIIGVNPDRGWASTAHIPALRALDRFEIRAASTSSQASAEAVAEKFGVASTPDYNELVARDDLDLVVVTVRAPKHLELVSAALRAGKAVYCEWPLGASLAEARTMALLADTQGVATIIGLQARQSPQVQYARDLVAGNWLGEVLSTSIVGIQSTGDVVDPANAYMMDKTTGASLLTVSVGHSVDMLDHVLGEFDSLSAVTAVRRPFMTVAGTSQRIAKTAADQVGVLGTLTSGAIASLHIHEGAAGGTGFVWEINGTEGTLRMTADWAVPEMFPLTIYGSKGGDPIAELDVPMTYRHEQEAVASLAATPAYNVARTYASFANDIDHGTHATAGFEQAVLRHELIAAIEAAAASGSRGALRPVGL
jgi:predicted dehydrogenase